VGVSFAHPWYTIGEGAGAGAGTADTGTGPGASARTAATASPLGLPGVCPRFPLQECTKCKDGSNCIFPWFYCDGTNDCKSGEDEGEVLCGPTFNCARHHPGEPPAPQEACVPLAYFWGTCKCTVLVLVLVLVSGEECPALRAHLQLLRHRTGEPRAPQVARVYPWHTPGVCPQVPLYSSTRCWCWWVGKDALHLRAHLQLLRHRTGGAPSPPK